MNPDIENEDLRYQFAQKRLVELFLKITIREKISYLRSSLSIPKENSFTSSLS